MGAQNGISHLEGIHQVHIQQPGLQGSPGRMVILEGTQQEGGVLLDHAGLHEDIHDMVDVGERFVSLHQHLGELGELGALLRIDAHDVAQEEDVVGHVAHLLGVLQLDLLELTLRHLETNEKRTDNSSTDIRSTH